MRKTIRKWFWTWDFEKEEKWLNEMAAQGLALVGVIIGEFLAARRGLGYLIIYGSQVFQLNMVITSIIILCIMAFCFYKGVQYLEHFIKVHLKM